MRKMHRQKNNNPTLYPYVESWPFHRVFECLEEYCASIDDTRFKEMLNVCRMDVSCKFTTQKVGADNKHSLQVITSRGSMASHQPLLSRRQCSQLYNVQLGLSSGTVFEIFWEIIWIGVSFAVMLCYCSHQNRMSNNNHQDVRLILKACIW